MIQNQFQIPSKIDSKIFLKSTSKWIPKWLQNRSKIDPKIVLKSTSKWTPKWLQNRPKMASKRDPLKMGRKKHFPYYWGNLA